MRFLFIFLVNRVVALFVMMLVLNAYLQTSGAGQGAGLPAQFDSVAQNFRTLAEAFR